ncbi:MAG: hypothetical protein EHM73_02420 [Chroococcales cyanobacterium metabat2.561]|uniref:Uncharacterized protein n=1 Tax=Microcystis aeruginosa Ma_SC_T_19800800_S464 TaxID=2486257 RepID=A0A552DRC8_MICAE|nr:MAG: hypothetical protein EHM73_02420 [Chroococcales cyanobacterium metabat2.561]TRT82534.1 MAG: hypothetical protein EWV82_11165 [Microcystis aeruginosa Ma_AC_P_19900807_S299]TRU24784.1 MAG: hypothetical protein EWV81_13355 [Microcystis aeruginosa Ma_SC_T_19800800_S464]
MNWSEYREISLSGFGHGSLILCVLSLTYYRSDQSLCPLCLEWFLPLPRQQDCILEYILPTKPKRAIIIPLLSEKEGFI